jgi:hypothetical protein
VNLRGKRGGLLLVDGDGNFVAGFLTEDEVLAGVCGAKLGDARFPEFLQVRSKRGFHHQKHEKYRTEESREKPRVNHRGGRITCNHRVRKRTQRVR